MPNGGPDCCGNCDFNKAVQEMEHPRNADQRGRFQALSRCTLRDVGITEPFWTYCYNFCHDRTAPGPDERKEIAGWIFAGGLYEGYVRIPWHGTIEPRVSVACVCVTCDRKTEDGITVFHDGRNIGFCTNRHYIDWWKTIHDDPSITSEGLTDPEATDPERS